METLRSRSTGGWPREAPAVLTVEATMLGAAIRHEAEHKAERQKRRRRQNAEADKVSGGGMRPYGYADDRITVIEEEAEAIRRLPGGRQVKALGHQR